MRLWTVDLLPEEFRRFPVIITELRCNLPMCAEINDTATEVAVLLNASHRLHRFKPTWDARVHKELADVTFDDLREALEGQLGLGVGLGVGAIADDTDSKQQKLGTAAPAAAAQRASSADALLR
eukprot:g4685.t1